MKRSSYFFLKGLFKFLGWVFIYVVGCLVIFFEDVCGLFGEGVGFGRVGWFEGCLGGLDGGVWCGLGLLFVGGFGLVVVLRISF